uniref:Uncharacterized protein MANES_02G125700 n=1 Tax=Rhizophora mucronata TaxID=61149 RepID=A0A2P2MZT9_RHIMU
MMDVDLQNQDSSFLPSQFVTSPVENKPLNQSWPSRFPSSDFGSLLSSSAESDFGSTESESDQDDEYTAELTRQMAHYMLQDDDTEHEKQELAMVENFEELNISEGMHKQVNGEKVTISGTSLEPTMAAAVPLTATNYNTSSIDFHAKPALIDDQIRAIQEQINKQRQEYVLRGKEASGYQQPEAKQQFRKSQSKGIACAGFNNKQKASFANLHWQQRNGSGMRAIFLNKSGSNSGSTGTGVFLPRGIGNTPESRRKPGCSTVLIPAKVVQALKLHFDKVGVPARVDGAGFLHQHEALRDDVKIGLQLKQTRQSRAAPAIEREISLPKEWTY